MRNQHAVYSPLFAVLLSLAPGMIPCLVPVVGATTQRSEGEPVAERNEGNFISRSLSHSEVYAFDSTPADAATQLAVFESVDFISNGSLGLLRWTTTSEEDNAGFEIEYRASGMAADFVSVGFVAGSGTTAARHAYRFGVRNMRPGIHEFRLKVSAKDGRYRYTQPIRFEIEAERQFALGEAAHDAEEGLVYVPYTVNVPGIVRVIIEDEAGNLVTTLAFGTHQAGTHVASFRISKSIPVDGWIWLHTEQGSTSRRMRLDLGH